MTFGENITTESVKKDTVPSTTEILTPKEIITELSQKAKLHFKAVLNDKNLNLDDYSREQILKNLGYELDEIIFTAGNRTKNYEEKIKKHTITLNYLSTITPEKLKEYGLTNNASSYYHRVKDIIEGVKTNAGKEKQIIAKKEVEILEKNPDLITVNNEKGIGKEKSFIIPENIISQITEKYENNRYVIKVIEIAQNIIDSVNKKLDNKYDNYGLDGGEFELKGQGHKQLINNLKSFAGQLNPLLDSLIITANEELSLNEEEVKNKIKDIFNKDIYLEGLNKNGYYNISESKINLGDNINA